MFVFRKYRVTSAAVILICSLITFVSLDSPSFDGKYWVFTFYGFVLSILVFILGLLFVTFRLFKTVFKNYSFYYALGLFNVLASFPFSLHGREMSAAVVVAVIIFPVTVGLGILLDVYFIDKKTKK